MAVDQEARRRKRMELFRQVANERIAKLNLLWIEFEQTKGDPAPFLREAHTLKGEASLMGYGAASQLIHGMEAYVKALRDIGRPPGQSDGDRVLKVLDLVLSDTLVDVESSHEPLEQYLRALTEATTELTNPNVMGPDPNTSAMPEVELGYEISETHRALTSSSLNLAPAHEEETPAPVPTALPRERLVRVTTEKIDHLRDMVSDLLLSNVRWRHLFREIRSIREFSTEKKSAMFAVGNDQEVASWGSMIATLSNIESRLRDEMHDLERLIGELDGTTRDLRMIPLGSLFERFPMLLRQVARTLGRKVVFEANGESIEVDKALLEMLEEPLLHLLRNAVDHGVEPPEVRVAKGKPAEAVVRIEAGMEGQRLRMAVSDDGAGIDIDRVRSRAVETGVLDAVFAAAATDDQILRSIFAAGFSTRGQASEISGRGIGLNIVLDVIENLGGRINVETRAGKGTTFHIDVPITIAITRVVLFRVGLGTYALPVGSVATLIERDPANWVENADGAFVRHNGGLVPVLDLVKLLGEPKVPGLGKRLIIVQNGGELVALLGSENHLEREVIMKPLGCFFERVSLVSAAVALEEGSQALVLKAAELMLLSRTRISRILRLEETDRQSVRGGIALVVDDSPVVREIVAQALRSHGVHVLTAGDGVEALSVFGTQGKVDVVVTDIDMPKLDGLGLLRCLRASDGGHAIPVVAISMRGSAMEKQAAMDAGMTAYIDKSDFNQALLWQTVRPYVVRS